VAALPAGVLGYHCVVCGWSEPAAAAGSRDCPGCGAPVYHNTTETDAAIARAVAAEREACAKAAEAGAWEPVVGEDYYQTVDVQGTANNIAAAIRARGGSR
jgi:hypothetical protein